jgi:hypothetical protein
MGYWLDATTSIQTHANPYSKEYGTQKSLSLVLVGFKIIFQSMHDIVCPHTTSCFLYSRYFLWNILSTILVGNNNNNKFIIYLFK